MSNVSKSILNGHVRSGDLSVDVHKFAKLSVYYPTPAVKKLMPFRIQHYCGIVLDDNGFVAARSFSGCIDYRNRPESFPNDDYEVTQKLNGHLVMVFRFADNIIVASRHGFNDEITQYAEYMVKDRFAPNIFRRGFTYIFELTTPKFPKVITYTGDSLTLLSIITTSTSEECTYPHLVASKKLHPIVPVVWGTNDIFKLAAQDDPVLEGSVIKFIKTNQRLVIRNKSFIERKECNGK